MAAAHDAAAVAAARHPPIRLEMPIEPHRRVNDLLGLAGARGGPVMAATEERWLAAHGRRIYCRVYRPRTDRPLPTLIYFHGGGWIWGSVDTHDRLVREYATAGEVNAVSVDYALSPEARFPTALEECAGFVRAFAESGGEWGLDPARLVLGGDSAGGNLALATALLLRGADGEAGPALRGILAAYPVCDADLERPSYAEFAAGHQLTREKMAFYWDAYAPGLDRLHPLAAPLRADLRGLPPVLIHLAELDVLRSEGEEMARRLRAAGVAVSDATFPGVLHGFLRAMATVGRAREAIAAAGAWLREVAR